MKILAIDTCENTAAAAVTEDEHLLASFHLMQTRTHSESMLPMIQSLLTQLHMTVDDIDLFAVSAGPGSFTGVRIGAATIKGLNFGKEKPIVAVSALEAMAWNHLGESCLVCPTMDARRGQVYAALFSVTDEEVSYVQGFEDAAVMACDLVAAIGQRFASKEIRFCGGAMKQMNSLAKDTSTLQVRFTPEPFRYENAYGVALCAYRKYRKNPACAVSDIALSPIYLRASQAERERLEKESQKEEANQK